MILTFCLSAWIQTQIDHGMKLNIAWQLLAYVLITISLILISITGLEYAFSQAPKAMKKHHYGIFLPHSFYRKYF